MPDPKTDSAARKPESKEQRMTGLAPETHNDGQDDHRAQAHTLATQAEALTQEIRSPTESEPAGNTMNLFGDSTQDLVEHMRDMESSGRIDMDAFAGEPDHGDRARPAGRSTDPAEIADKRR